VVRTVLRNLLQHFTGSAEHNVALRAYAQRAATRSASTTWSTSPAAAGSRAPLRPRSTSSWACTTSARATREPGRDRGVRKRAAPRLIELPDVRGDLHVTRIGRTAEPPSRRWLSARWRGPRVHLLRGPLAVAGHGQRAGAGAIGPAEGSHPRVGRPAAPHHPAVRDRGRHPGGRPARLPDETLAQLDFVTASIHSGFTQPRRRS